MTRARCMRCIHIVPAAVVVEGISLCRAHGREAQREKRDVRVLPVKGRTALGVVLAFAMLVGASALALEPTDGARDGETLPARIERLRAEISERQTALRLSLAELRINRNAMR